MKLSVTVTVCVAIASVNLHPNPYIGITFLSEKYPQSTEMGFVSVL